MRRKKDLEQVQEMIKQGLDDINIVSDMYYIDSNELCNYLVKFEATQLRCILDLFKNPKDGAEIQSIINGMMDWCKLQDTQEMINQGLDDIGIVSEMYGIDSDKLCDYLERFETTTLQGILDLFKNPEDNKTAILAIRDDIQVPETHLTKSSSEPHISKADIYVDENPFSDSEVLSKEGEQNTWRRAVKEEVERQTRQGVGSIGGSVL